MRAVHAVILFLSLPAWAAGPADATGPADAADAAAKEDACLVREDYRACAGLAMHARIRSDHFHQTGARIADAACEAGDGLACVAFVDFTDKHALLEATRKGCAAGAEDLCATAAQACEEEPALCSQSLGEALSQACSALPLDADEGQRARALLGASLGSVELQAFMGNMATRSPDDRKRAMRKALKDAGIRECAL